MFKYYQNNIVYGFKVYVFICTLLIVFASVLTTYIVTNNYKKYKTISNDTFVFAPNGASISIKNSSEYYGKSFGNE